MIGLVAACIAKLLGGDKYTILFSTFAASVLVGIAKEIYDDSVDWYDMIADFVGVAAACIFSFILVFG